MTRNSNAHMRDGFVLAESDLVDFLSGSTDSAINFSGSADLHTPIHPPPETHSDSVRDVIKRDEKKVVRHQSSSCIYIYTSWIEIHEFHVLELQSSNT